MVSATISFVRSSSVGTETAGRDHDVAARERLANRFLYARGIITHRNLAINCNAQLRKAARDILRVRIRNLTHQKLRTHRQNFRNHFLFPSFSI